MGNADMAECLTGNTKSGVDSPSVPGLLISSVATGTGQDDPASSEDSQTLAPHLQHIVDKLEGLTEEETGKVSELLRQYSDVFSASEFDLGCTPLMEHRIDTGTARPVRQALRRHPQAQLDIIDEQVNKMLEAGIIEKAASPWASNVVLVKKAEPGAPPRCTIDYQRQ